MGKRDIVSKPRQDFLLSGSVYIHSSYITIIGSNGESKVNYRNLEMRFISCAYVQAEDQRAFLCRKDKAPERDLRIPVAGFHEWAEEEKAERKKLKVERLLGHHTKTKEGDSRKGVSNLQMSHMKEQ